MPFPVNPISLITQSTTVTLNRQSQNCNSRHLGQSCLRLSFMHLYAGT